MVTLSAIFTPDQPPEQILPVAAAAETAGMTHLWVWEDCFKESGIATATAMLATTSRLTVGIGLLPVPLRNVALAGELADGVIISSGPSPDEIRATASHFRASRPQGAAGEIVVFTSASADSPARDIAATVSEFAAAGATHVAVNADEHDADLERFVGLLAQEVSPLVRPSCPAA